VKVLHGDPASWDAGGPHAVTIGVYDGVHRGHLHLLGLLVERAAGMGLPTGLVTFDRHPLTVIAPERAPLLLTSLNRKIELFQDARIDVTGVLPFANGVRGMTAGEFATTVLAGAFRARLVMVGEDFKFGKDRGGDADLLASLGAEHGFEVQIIPLVGDEQPISSTRIRALIAAGDVAGAAQMLGRPLELRGRVVRGAGRGSRIGIPTANLEVAAGRAIPGRGVYAVRVGPRGAVVADGVLNIGVRPTFGSSDQVIEVHVIDGGDDLYGEVLRVHLYGRIRPERQFSGPDELVAQIQTDIAAARRILSQRAP
jgi:riboflavin kinase/FMN adenylyltransferase